MIVNELLGHKGDVFVNNRRRRSQRSGVKEWLWDKRLLGLCRSRNSLTFNGWDMLLFFDFLEFIDNANHIFGSHHFIMA